MSKVKYFYDPDTLSYRKIEPKKSRKYRNVALFLAGSALFGFFGLAILLNTSILNTPQELSLQREVKNYELRFELLNKKMEQIEQVLGNIEDRDNNIYGVYFEANPIPDEQRRAGFGGVNRYKSLEGFNNSDMIISTTKRLDIIQKEKLVTVGYPTFFGYKLKDLYDFFMLFVVLCGLAGLILYALTPMMKKMMHGVR